MTANFYSDYSELRCYPPWIWIIFHDPQKSADFISGTKHYPDMFINILVLCNGSYLLCSLPILNTLMKYDTF